MNDSGKGDDLGHGDVNYPLRNYNYKYNLFSLVTQSTYTPLGLGQSLDYYIRH